MVDLEKKIYQQKKELNDPAHPRKEIKIEAHEEELLLDTIVYAESMNIWAMLMPAVYQLVPGSMIAKMWFNTIIPPSNPADDENVFAGLMVTSISLALGLIIGEAIVEIFAGIFNFIFKTKTTKKDQGLEEDAMDFPMGWLLNTYQILSDFHGPHNPTF